MIGVFDSGRGGMLAVRFLKETLPYADIAFFGDCQNAPYGTKTEEELIKIVKNDIDRLKAVGVRHVLSACCTASSVVDRLPAEYREICFPIIRPTVNHALQLSKNKRIGVIATEATVRSHVFQKTIKRYDPEAEVLEIPAQKLVSLAEASRTSPRDGLVNTTCRQIAVSFSRFPMDTLILGCTHFPLFSESLSSFFPGVQLISSVTAGTAAFAKTLSENERCGRGKLLSLS